MYSSGPRKRTFLGDLKLRGTVHHSQPIKDTADTDPARPAPNADLVLPPFSTVLHNWQASSYEHTPFSATDS